MNRGRTSDHDAVTCASAPREVMEVGRVIAAPPDHIEW